MISSFQCQKNLSRYQEQINFIYLLMTYLTTPSVAQTTCRTVTWVTNNELERKKSQPTYRYYPKICLKGVGKATETSVRTETSH